MSETQGGAGGHERKSRHLMSTDELAAELRRKAKKDAKRESRKGETKSLDVNINSLLDVLSVILVFLMKSYSNATVQVKPSAELQPPFTRSGEAAMDTTAITVTLKNIMVDDAPVLTLEAGKIAEQDLADQRLLIQPLLSRLQDEVRKLKRIQQQNPRAVFDGKVTIIADRNVPFELLTQVMYTAGLAEFGKFDFVGVKLEGG